MNKYVLILASLLAFSPAVQAYTFAPATTIHEVAQHADFADVAELRVIAANSEMQKAWVARENAKTEIKLQEAALGRTFIQGMGVVAAGLLICSFVEWLNEYRARCARTSKEIEKIKLNLAIEKERAAKKIEAIQKGEQEAQAYAAYAISVTA